MTFILPLLSGAERSQSGSELRTETCSSWSKWVRQVVGHQDGPAHVRCEFWGGKTISKGALHDDSCLAGAVSLYVCVCVCVCVL